MLCFDYLLVTF